MFGTHLGIHPRFQFHLVLLLLFFLSLFLYFPPPLKPVRLHMYWIESSAWPVHDLLYASLPVHPFSSVYFGPIWFHFLSSGWQVKQVLQGLNECVFSCSEIVRMTLLWLHFVPIKLQQIGL